MFCSSQPSFARTARCWIFLLCLLAAVPFSGYAALEGFESAARNSSRIDDTVAAQLQRLNLSLAEICSDAVFVRRVYLDVIGTIPTAAEARDFLSDKKPGKRAELIERLLAREEFADYWAMKWCDLLRVKAEFPINLWPNAAQAYHRYIRSSIAENKQFDQFARELLTSSGSNFRVGQVNFYRAMQNREPQGIAQSVALIFLGARVEHWPATRRDGLTAFFSQVGYKATQEWKEEIVFFEPSRATNGLWRAAMLPDGTKVKLTEGEDPRCMFADWLLQPENRWFARNIANRSWAWLMGRGIIHEPDDVRDDNPPCNPELLAALEQIVIESRYDLKALYRAILNSKTYQASAGGWASKAEANFASYPVRRLEGEVLIDALNRITSSTEKYSSPIPEPFTFIPAEMRAIALPDGSITSPFLEMFGKSPRDTGREAERNNRITAQQRLHLLNSSHIQNKITQSRMVQYQLQGNRPLREIASAVYLGILSRYPTAKELELIEASASGAASRREAVVDLAWALINSSEFLYRH